MLKKGKEGRCGISLESFNCLISMWSSFVTSHNHRVHRQVVIIYPTSSTPTTQSGGHPVRGQADKAGRDGG